VEGEVRGEESIRGREVPRGGADIEEPADYLEILFFRGRVRHTSNSMDTYIM
jgi:hypothetical protein